MPANPWNWEYIKLRKSTCLLKAIQKDVVLLVIGETSRRLLWCKRHSTVENGKNPYVMVISAAHQIF